MKSFNFLLSIMLFYAINVNAQQGDLEVTGALNLGTMLPSGSDSVVVWGSDGKLGVRDDLVSRAYVDVLENRIFELEYSLGKDSIADIEGNNYKIKKIGNQYWMVENLRTTRYSDGSSIDSANTIELWTADNTNGKWCWYGGDITMIFELKYGKLYNWYAANNNKGLCPSGWHVPSDSEWNLLTAYLVNNGFGFEGSGTDIGKSMASTLEWNRTSKEGTIGYDKATNNSSGFSGLPGGYCNRYRQFKNLSLVGSWWSSTEEDSLYGKLRYLSYISANVILGGATKSTGLSIRCVKN